MSEKKITIRLETKDDYRNVENLNREPCRCKKQVDPRLAKLASLLQEKE